jgi:hypothetical protein
MFGSRSEIVERSSWDGQERRRPAGNPRSANAEMQASLPEPDVTPWLKIYRDDSKNPSVDQIAHEMLAHAFREAALKHHPDNGGDPENIRRVYQARNLLLRGLHKA